MAPANYSSPDTQPRSAPNKNSILKHNTACMFRLILSVNLSISFIFFSASISFFPIYDSEIYPEWYILCSQLTILAILIFPGWHHRFELCTTLQTRRGCHPWRLPKSPGELWQIASYPPAYMTYSYHIPHPWPMGHRAWLRPRGYVWRSLGSTLTLQLQHSTNIGTSSFINDAGRENSQFFDLVKVLYRCDILNAQVEWGIPNFSAEDLWVWAA